jgi:hypothetical protein
MEIVAHGLWGAAAAITSKRLRLARPRFGWALWWSVFPDVLAFGPTLAAGLWFRLAGGSNAGTDHGHLLPHIHLGLPLYQIGHSLVVFLIAFGIITILSRHVLYAMLGWLLHIGIDIPTHSLSYYATRFLWPVSDYRVDGIAWWTPWFWTATYVVLGVMYFLLWRNGWLPITIARPDPARHVRKQGCDLRGPDEKPWASAEHKMFKASVSRLRLVGGFALLVAGIICAIPGVPGPGLAMIVIALLVLQDYFNWPRKVLTWVRGKVRDAGLPELSFLGQSPNSSGRGLAADDERGTTPGPIRGEKET